MEANTEKRPYHRRVANVAPDPTIEPMEMQCGQDNPRLMRSDGPASESLEPALIEPIERPLSAGDAEKLAMLKFAEDMVTVFIHQSTNPADEKVFQVFNNGKCELFRRGETKTVRRKFVEGLARAKVTNFTQEEVIKDGEKHLIQMPHTAPRYPFSVTHDPHPRGAEWLRSVMAEA